MRTLFVGDVHGCAGAFERLIRLAKPEAILLLGDIFAKGPDPAGVWRIIQETGATGIMGNHDMRLLSVWGKPGESGHHRCARALPEAARAWTSALPLTRSGVVNGRAWRAVHAGVNPMLGWAGTTSDQALVLRRWPDDALETHPFWWELYTGAEQIFYGHDAMRGVQIHEHTVGLDSGCVYGGELTGMILETGEVVGVSGAG